MNIEKGNYAYVECPQCHSKYESLSQEESGNVVCPHCKNVLVDNSMDLKWIDKTVNAVRCPKCNKLITCTPENMLMAGFGIADAVCCDKCFDRTKKGVRIPVVIAIRYKNSWHIPQYFLSDQVKEGLKIVKNIREWIALSTLNYESEKEGYPFRTPSNKDKSLHKIYWKNGEAIGYYSYYKLNPIAKTPTLNVIYIRPEYRKQGYGTLIWKDFTEQFNSGVIYVESPDTEFRQLLAKLHEIKIYYKNGEYNGYKCLGRVRLVNW